MTSWDETMEAAFKTEKHKNKYIDEETPPDLTEDDLSLHRLTCHLNGI